MPPRSPSTRAARCCLTAKALIRAADEAGIAIQAFAPDSVRGKNEIVSEKPIRVAVVGAGEFGKNHVRVWRELEGAELAGIVDTNAERARQVAAEFGTRVIPNLEALAAAGVHAVSVAVPTKEHARVGCRLLEAGIDVLVEKPMAASLEEAEPADCLRAAFRSHSANRARRAIQSRSRARRKRSFRAPCFSKSTASAFSRRAAWISTSCTT